MNKIAVTPHQLAKINELQSMSDHGKRVILEDHEIFGFLKVAFVGPRYDKKSYVLDAIGQPVDTEEFDRIMPQR